MLKIRRWRSMLALLLIAVGLFFDWYWVWGVLFIIWAINDLRNKHTYLLEDIPRAESPVLYWIIIVLWISLSTWSLSFFNWQQVKGDVQYVISQDFSVVRGCVAATPESAGMTTLSDAKAGFKVMVPSGWTHTVTEEDYATVMEIQSPKRYGNVTVIAIDWTVPVATKDFAQFMDKELLKEYPLLKSGKRTKLTEKDGSVISTKYAGTFEGEEVELLVTYRSKGNFGYAVLGVYGIKDKPRANAVISIMQSFSLGTKQPL